MNSILAHSANAVANHFNQLIKEQTSFELSSITRIFNSNDSYNQAFYEDTSIKYPFITYQIRNISLAVDKLGSAVTHKQNLPVAQIKMQKYPQPNEVDYMTNVTGDRIKHSKVLPVNYELIFNFLTNSPTHFDELIEVWFRIYPTKTFYLELENILPIPITFVPVVDSILFPEKETNDPATYYKGELVANITIKMGTMEEVSLIKETPKVESKPLEDAQGQSIGGIIQLTNKSI